MTHPEALRPFTIEILFPEGLPDGLRIVAKPNWSGLVIVCPRNRYAEAKKQRDEFSWSGVYILVGLDEDDSQKLYVGEAETIRDRLNQHHAEKDFWNRAIIFTQRNAPLNKAHVQYLESHLVKLAKTYKNWKLDNSQEPREPKLSESDKAFADGYLREILLILPVLGVDAFTVGEETQIKAHRYYHYKSKEWAAIGDETSNGFRIQKGSSACLNTRPTLHPSPRNKRDQLIEEEILVKEDEVYRFTVDHTFNSPSQAACVCAGYQSNGRTSWKDQRGVTLRAHQEEEAK